MSERDAEIARLRQELETERIRLVACGVVAIADTSDSAARARDMHADYRSASYDDVARRVDECMALRAQLAAAQADAVALGGALEQVHGLNVAWQGDLSQHCADPLTVLDNMLAITEPIVSTAKSPGAPLLDAVRGLVAAGEDLLRNAQQVLDDIGPVRRRQSIDGANMSQEFSDMYTDAREAMRIALAAVRALVPA